MHGGRELAHLSTAPDRCTQPRPRQLVRQVQLLTHRGTEQLEAAVVQLPALQEVCLCALVYQSNRWGPCAGGALVAAASRKQDMARGGWRRHDWLSGHRRDNTGEPPTSPRLLRPDSGRVRDGLDGSYVAGAAHAQVYYSLVTSIGCDIRLSFRRC
jgi:hypothetical protein